MENEAQIPYYYFRHLDGTRSQVSGLAMLNPGWCHIRRRLETETVLIVGKKGSALIEDNGRSFEIAAGRMLLLPAGHLHVGARPVKEALSYWWFHFYQCISLDDEMRIFLPKALDQEQAQSFLQAPEKEPALFRDGIILPQTMALSRPSLTGTLCSEALEAFAREKESPLAYYNALIRLLLELGRQSAEQAQAIKESRGPESSSRALVKQVLELLENELSNHNASVKFFADRLGVNADYLGRCFKEVMKTPVGQYVSRRRVELASSRLRESNRSVEEIAAECGFGSRRQFFDEFKRRTGKTPAAYRAESAYVGINAL
ncbi:MAG: AraC family transcriptional regulator [Treponema sp.]|nr:AraC family transcriptional regulator [Treponema sp.]